MAAGASSLSASSATVSVHAVPCTPLTRPQPAGLAVNTVYGAQEYWPEEKLRMCVESSAGAAAAR